MQAGIEFLPHHQTIRQGSVELFLGYLTHDTAGHYNEAARADKEAWDGIGTTPIQITVKNHSKVDKQALADAYRQNNTDM